MYEAAGRMQLWQSINDETRFCVDVEMKSLNLNDREIVMIPYNDCFNFRGHLPVFFHSNKNSTIFKMPIFHNGPYKIVLKIPDKVMIREKRDEPRRVMDSEDHIIHYSFGSNTVGKGAWSQSGLIDVSGKL